MPRLLSADTTFRSLSKKHPKNNSSLLVKTVRQLEIIAKRYRTLAWQEYAGQHNFKQSCVIMERIIRHSGLFELDFKENEIFATGVRTHLEGLSDLEKLLEGIKNIQMMDNYEPMERAALKNFYENYWEWRRTALDFSGPRPDWTPPRNIEDVENPKLAELRSMSKKERKKYWNEL